MTENQPEAPGRTELEHRIGQATEEAESMAMEGGIARACALRFLAALEVPEAEWPSARDATRSPESAREVPGVESPAPASLEGVTAILAALEGGEGEAPPLSREELGRLVREVWVACAREHPDPKPSWLAGWDELDEWDRETDRRIGKVVANHAAAVTAVAMHGLHVTAVAEAVSAERERIAAVRPVTAAVLRSQVRAAVHSWAETDMNADPADAVMGVAGPWAEQVAGHAVALAHAALDRATERMRAAEGKLANLRSLAEGCRELASNGRDLDANCTASAAYRAVAGDILAIIGTGEENHARD